MKKDFEKLVDAVNKPKSGSLSKIIKSKTIQAGQVKELNLWDFSDKTKKSAQEKTENSEKRKKVKDKKQFIIEPEYENKTLRKLQVSCSCGNETEIKFVPDPPNEPIDDNLKENPE
tara:strand:+ start:402 stop:749 length:348 start_codon:yes stop_codon:yes gene_type:complete